MSDNSTSFDINFKTTADTSGGEQVIEVQKKIVEQGQEVAEQTGQQNTATDAASDSEKKLAAEMDASKKSIADKIAALKEGRAATDDSTQATGEFDASILKLPSGLRAMAGGLGAASLAVGVMKAGFDAWLTQNPELQASLDQTTEQVSKLSTGVLSEWFETWIMKAETGKSILDSITIALGGETAAMEAARAPMAGYADEKEQAAIKTQAFIDILDEEAAAAKRAMDALEGEVEQLRLRNELDAARGGLDANRKKREIDAGSGSKEDKEKAKAAVDAQAAVEQQQRDEAERNKDTEVAAEQAKIAKDEAARLKQETATKEKQMRDASLRGGLADQNKALNEQLKEAEVWTKGGGGVDKSAEVESLKKQIADNQRGIDTLKPGDVDALKKEAEKLKERAEAAEKEAAKAAAAAANTRNKNDQLNEIGRVKTRDRVESLLPPAQPGGYNPSPLDGDTNPLGNVGGNKAPNRYDRIPPPPPSASPIGGGGNPLGDIGGQVDKATEALSNSLLEGYIGELGQGITSMAEAVISSQKRTEEALKATNAKVETLASQIKNAR